MSSRIEAGHWLLDLRDGGISVFVPLGYDLAAISAAQRSAPLGTDLPALLVLAAASAPQFAPAPPAPIPAPAPASEHEPPHSALRAPRTHTA